MVSAIQHAITTYGNMLGKDPMPSIRQPEIGTRGLESDKPDGWMSQEPVLTPRGVPYEPSRPRPSVWQRFIGALRAQARWNLPKLT